MIGPMLSDLEFLVSKTEAEDADVSTRIVIATRLYRQVDDHTGKLLSREWLCSTRVSRKVDSLLMQGGQCTDASV